jgi:hypothetical protein
MENADALVRASKDSGLPLYVACAMIQKESNGQNIYRHDNGGIMNGAGEVTEENFKNEFLPQVLNGATSNGVGPVFLLVQKLVVQYSAMMVQLTRLNC